MKNTSWRPARPPSSTTSATPDQHNTPRHTRHIAVQTRHRRRISPLTTLLHLILITAIAIIGVLAPAAAPRWLPTALAQGTPNTITVNSTEDTAAADGQCTLREAINAANSDAAVGGCAAGSGADVIDLSSQSGTILLQSSLPPISTTLTIQGPGAGSLTVDGDNSVTVFFVTPNAADVLIEGLTIANGEQPSEFDRGGGFYNAGTLTLRGTTVFSSTASFGSGGGIDNDGTMTVIDSTISGNGDSGNGGGIRNTGTMAIRGGSIEGNSADDGGGIYNGLGGTLEVSAVSILGNTATDGEDGDGGGIANNGTLTVNDSTISNNTADYGGGIGNIDGTLSVNRSTISGNSTNNFGGGLYSRDGTLSVNRSTISSNTADTGGGISISNGTLALTRSTIISNVAGSTGGGIRNFDGYTLIDSSLLHDNEAAQGGGVAGDAAFITEVFESVTTTLRNSTVSGNRATSTDSDAAGGGAVWHTRNSFADSTLIIEHSTIVNNTAAAPNEFRSGIVFSDTLLLSHSIVANNGSGADNFFVDGTLTSQGYNLTSSAGVLNGEGDQEGVDPVLGDLTDNGGATLTHAPLAGSPAINGGEPGLLPAFDYDQRGPDFLRVRGGQIDIGAYETNVLASAAVCDGVADIPRVECDALVALYNSTNGPNWTNSSGWLVGVPCNWEGVVCQNGQVIGLLLEDNNLDGPLPPELGNLGALQDIRLSGNQLRGTIPDTYAGLAGLLALDVENNPLSGPLPLFLAEMGSLEQLKFAGTDMCEPTVDFFQRWLDTLVATSRTDICRATISLEKSIDPQAVAPGEMVTFDVALRVEEAGPTAATTSQTTSTSATDEPGAGLAQATVQVTVLTDTLPVGLEFVRFTQSNGAYYDPETRQIRYDGPVSISSPINISYEAMVSEDVAEGIMLSSLVEADDTNVKLHDTTDIGVIDATEYDTLLLIYYAADNNLSDDGLTVLNSAERAITNTNVAAVMMLDGSIGTPYTYRIQHDMDPGCPNYFDQTCGRYVENRNLTARHEYSADVYALAEFLKVGIVTFPNADKVIVSLIGHGSGINAQSTVAKPGDSSRRYDPIGGLLEDNNPEPASFSTRALGDALELGLERAQLQPGITRDSIDGLYLDSCLMGMGEVAYEIRDSVDYLLASTNIKWIVPGFDEYEHHINAIDGTQNTPEILEQWMANEVSPDFLRDNFLYTYSVLDLSQIGEVHGALDELVTELGSNLDQTRIERAFDQSAYFDTNSDDIYNAQTDNYVDIDSFASALESEFSDDVAIINAAQRVRSAVGSAVITETHQTTFAPPYADQPWDEESLGGISLYMPLKQDDCRRNFYDNRHYQFTAQGQWDDFLSDYWNNADPPAVDSCPPGGPIPLQPGTAGGENMLYLPLMQQ